jgi:hypothetical protein
VASLVPDLNACLSESRDPHSIAIGNAGWLWAVIGGCANRLRDARNASSRVVIGKESEAKGLGQVVLAMRATEAVALIPATASQKAAK